MSEHERSELEQLTEIAQTLARVELALEQRIPRKDIQQALEDILATHGLVAQLREVYTTQRDELAALVITAATILAELHAGGNERDEISALLVQLLELGRKHVEGLYNLERAITWRHGDKERRGAKERQR